MDRRIEELLEDHLRKSLTAERQAEFDRAVAAEDAETQRLIEQFEHQARLIRGALRPAADVEPAPGFYGRVMTRIEAQRTPSLWAAFVEPLFFKRLALATATLLMLLSVGMLTTPDSDQVSIAPIVATTAAAEPIQVADNQAAPAAHESNRDIVLVDLVSFQQ
jgi:hypothetical protein